jgi:hypothetical protein
MINVSYPKNPNGLKTRKKKRGKQKKSEEERVAPPFVLFEWESQTVVGEELQPKKKMWDGESICDSVPLVG